MSMKPPIAYIENAKMPASGLSDEVLLRWQLQAIATMIVVQGNVSRPGPCSLNLCIAYTKKYIVYGMLL